MSGSRIRFQFLCERCTSPLEASVEDCGSQVRCPSCGAGFLVPPLNPTTRRAVGKAGLREGSDLAPSHTYAADGAHAPRIIGSPTDGTQVIECPQCKTWSSIEASGCNKCGTPFTIEAVTAISTAEISGLATASLVVGLLSILACAVFLGPIAVLLGYLALTRIESMVAPPKERRRVWAGIILGGIATLILAFLLLSGTWP